MSRKETETVAWEFHTPNVIPPQCQMFWCYVFDPRFFVCRCSMGFVRILGVNGLKGENSNQGILKFVLISLAFIDQEEPPSTTPDNLPLVLLRLTLCIPPIMLLFEEETLKQLTFLPKFNTHTPIPLNHYPWLGGSCTSPRATSSQLTFHPVGLSLLTPHTRTNSPGRGELSPLQKLPKTVNRIQGLRPSALGENAT